jgi:hypothetical protein
MPEVPNAYKCDYCRSLMEPVEQKTDRWHTKWCSVCGAKLYDVFIGDAHTEVPKRLDPWRDENAEAGIK